MVYLWPCFTNSFHTVTAIGPRHRAAVSSPRDNQSLGLALLEGRDQLGGVLFLVPRPVEGTTSSKRPTTNDQQPTATATATATAAATTTTTGKRCELENNQHSQLKYWGL